MFKENKLATILFILIFGGLICVLLYTPFYLKDYKPTKNEQIKEESPTTPSLQPQDDEEETNKPESKTEEPTLENEQKDEEKEDEKVEPINLKLTIEVNGQKYPATLEDNETTRAFIKKLPLEITMKELNGNEKYYQFTEKLPSNPLAVNKINKGDLMLYGDDTLVLFYDTFTTPYTYTKIANISDEDNGMLKTNLGTKDSKIKFYQ